jgi:hypothetical protein
MTTLSTPLIEAPASDPITVREPLAYLDAHDAVSNAEYAFVAFKETHRASGTWCVRINSLHTSSSVFHRNAMRLQARATSEQGKSWFTWGPAINPTATDPRQIKFHVHVRNGQPTAIEIMIRMRKFDHSADDMRTVTFPWPAN